MFTEIFVKILQSRQITAYQIAKETGISQGLMGEYKKGIKIPTTQNLIKIADYLNVSIDLLLGREISQNSVLTAVDKSDRNKQRLLRNYDTMNESAQEHIANYSDFMVSNETNLKSDIQNNKMKA